jgi:hypothetical protein
MSAAYDQGSGSPGGHYHGEQSRSPSPGDVQQRFSITRQELSANSGSQRPEADSGGIPPSMLYSESYVHEMRATPGTPFQQHR